MAKAAGEGGGVRRGEEGLRGRWSKRGEGRQGQAERAGLGGAW